MSASKASIHEIALHKIGRALELARTATDQDERSYFLGSADALIDFINSFENRRQTLSRREVQEALDALELADRVDAAFDTTCRGNYVRRFVNCIARIIRWPLAN